MSTPTLPTAGAAAAAPAAAAPAPLAPVRATVPARAAGAGAGRATRTPSLLRLGGALVAALAVVAALAIAVTTAGRTAAVGRLADSTAAVSTATGDAAAGFAQADAAAAALATKPDDAAELRYLQGLATGANQLEQAARLTRLGESAEAPIRRALRSLETYSADVTRAHDAATAGGTDRNAAARATATMANLIRANTEQVGDLHDAAVHTDAGSLRDGRIAAAALTLVPMVALLALLVALQLLTARRFRRLVNIPLLLATVLALGVTVRTVQLQQRQTDRVASAVDGPYQAGLLLTRARVAAFEAEGDRTAGAATAPASAAQLSQAVAAAAEAAPAGETPTDADAAHQTHALRLAADLTTYQAAVASAGAATTGTTFGGPAMRFDVLDAELLSTRRDASAELTASFDAARAGQTTLTWLAPAVLALVAGLAALGLQRRLAEYR